MRALLLAGLLLLTACIHRPSTRPQPLLLDATPGEILEQVRRPGARAVLLNVWATWCDPCREEMPDLLRLHRDLAAEGLRLVLVSADFESAVPEAERFLRGEGVDFPTWRKVGDDMAFIRAVHPDWTGSLPATVLYDDSGEVRWFHQGVVTYEGLREALAPLLEE